MNKFLPRINNWSWPRSFVVATALLALILSALPSYASEESVYGVLDYGSLLQSFHNKHIIPLEFSYIQTNTSRGASAPTYLWPVFHLNMPSQMFMDDGLDSGQYYSATPDFCRFYMNRQQNEPVIFKEGSNVFDSINLTSLRLKEWISRCEDQMLYPAILRGLRAYGVLGIRYNFEDYRGYMPVRLKFSNQTSTRAILGLKARQKRPLVIFRSGIFSNTAHQQAERFLIQHLFDASPFHILILPSTTGSDYTRDNPNSEVGADVEAQQIEEIMSWLSDPTQRLGYFVSDVHLVGASLGSQGMIRYLADHPDAAVVDTGVVDATVTDAPAEARPSHLKKVNSFVALCPVLDFKAAIEPKLANVFSKFFVGLWANHRLQEFAAVHNFSQEKSYIESVFGYFSSLPNFWQRQDVKSDLLKIKAPSWIFASKDDPLVPFATNAALLDPLQLPKSLELFYLNNGGHCYFPANFKRNDMLDAITLMQRTLSKIYPQKLTNANSLLEIESFVVEDNPSDAAEWRVRIQFFNGNVLSIPRTDTSYHDLAGPLSDTEKEMIHRWASRNLFTLGNDLYAAGL